MLKDLEQRQGQLSYAIDGDGSSWLRVEADDGRVSTIKLDERLRAWLSALLAIGPNGLHIALSEHQVVPLAEALLRSALANPKVCDQAKAVARSVTGDRPAPSIDAAALASAFRSAPINVNVDVSGVVGPKSSTTTVERGDSGRLERTETVYQYEGRS